MSLGGCNILVAEDDPTIRSLILEVLEMLGVHAEAVSDGKMLLKVLEHGDFDLVLMDCRMPELDGYEATREVRNGHAGGAREIPIIALTANAGASDRARCVSAGMNDCLSKPFSIAALESLLDKWLPATVDFAQIAKLPPGDLFSRLIDRFVADLPRTIQEMKTAISAANASELGRHAHRMKSSSLTLGATSLSKICGELERVCDLAEERSPPPEARELLERLERCARRSAEALRSYDFATRSGTG